MILWGNATSFEKWYRKICNFPYIEVRFLYFVRQLLVRTQNIANFGSRKFVFNYLLDVANALFTILRIRL